MELNKFNFEEIKKMKGQKIKGFHDIALRPDGSMMRIPYYVVVGEQDGPVFLAEGGIHGDEVVGGEQAAMLAAELDPKELKGIYLCIPHLNLGAFNIGRRTDRATDLTTPDWNRNFPGNRDNGKIGVYSVAEYVEYFVSNANYILSYHSGGNTLHLEPICFYIDGPADSYLTQETLKMSKAFGTRLMAKTGFNPAFGNGVLRAVTDKLNIPLILAEIGGNSSNYGYQEEWAKLYHDGTINVLKVLGMLPGEVKFRDDQITIKQQFMHGLHGGVFHPLVKPLQMMKEGELMAVTRDIFGEVIEEHRAPYDGIISGFWTGCVIHPREWTILYGAVIPNE